MARYRHAGPGNDSFFPLDNSAVFMASISNKRSPYVFRVSCELEQSIYLPDLEDSVAHLSQRFPFLSTRLRMGFFWAYLDPIDLEATVLPDACCPCEPFNIKSKSQLLYRVRVYGRRISCEFHHILTDGTGALEIMRTLLADYLTRRGVTCSDWGTIIRPESFVEEAELDDAYASLFRKHVPFPDPLPQAYHLNGKRYSGSEFRITTATLSVAEVLRVSREYKVSITEYLTAVYLASLQDIQENEGSSTWKPLCVQVPVNMRKFHPSPTLRNFFLFVSISIDRRLGHYDFEEIVQLVHHSMRLLINKKELDRQIKRNVRGERYILSRIIPLGIKNFFLRLIGDRASEGPFSGNLSNLQSVQMPLEFAAHIRRFDFIPSRKKSAGAAIGIVSWNDLLSVSVGSVVIDRSFEKFFYRRCADAGLTITVESNI